MKPARQILISVAVGFGLLSLSTQAFAKIYYATQSTDKTWCVYKQFLNRDKVLGSQGIYLWADIEYDQGKITGLVVNSSDGEFETFRKDTYKIYGLDDYDISRVTSYPRDKDKQSYLYKFRKNELVFRSVGATSWEPPVPYKLSYFLLGKLFDEFEANPSAILCSKVN